MMMTLFDEEQVMRAYVESEKKETALISAIEIYREIGLSISETIKKIAVQRYDKIRIFNNHAKCIREHIKLFGLNSPERKNIEVGKYCKNVIDDQSIMKGVKYNNLVVDLFRKSCHA